MARIQTYDQDSNVTFQDKLIGTDSASSATKNFTIQSLMDVINQLSGIDLFDGIVFKYQAFEPAATDPAGALNLVGGAAATQAFSATTQIIVSKKVVNGIDVENYVSSFLGKKIKVSKQGDFDKFGVFRVTNVQNHSNTRYLVLTVTHKESNGNFEPNSYYFLSFYGLPLVTDLEDVTNAGSGLIITDTERTALGTALQPADIIDNVTSTDTNKALSANQGKILKGLVDDLLTLLDVDAADKPALDTLREVVNFCQVNAATLSSLGISSIAGLQAALNDKVDVVTGKALSENDFTNALLTKLNGIAAGAEVNVKPDFNATTGDANEILNIPSDITNLSAHNATELSDITSAGSGNIISSAERTKLTGIETSADVTNTTKVTAAGALMDSEVTNLSQVKAFDTTDYATAAQGAKADSAQQPPSEGAFVDGDKTKLDNTISGSTSGVANKIAIWSGASTLTQDTNLHWDTSNDRLGIGTSSPSHKLEVSAKGTQLGSSGYYINSSFNDTDNNVGVFTAHNDTSSGVGAIAGINQLAFLTYGSSWEERMRIDANGNVAINDSTTSNLSLTVTSKSGYEDVAYFKSSGTNIDARINLFPTGTGNGAINSASNSLELQTGGTERMRINSSGNVGIGTTSPAEKLTVSGNGNFTGKLAVGSTASHPTYEFYNQDRAYFNGAVIVDDTFTQSGGGNSTFSGNVTVDAGSSGMIDFGDVTSAYGRLYADSTGTYVGSKTNHDLILRTNNTERLRINTSGVVTFAGDVTISGDLTVDGTTTTLNTQTVEVEDNILQLNTTQGTPDTATATTSGISVYRGDGVTQASLIFDDTDDTWDLTNNLSVSGKVGIGTTSPAAKLDIQGDGADFFLQSADFKIARIQPRGTGANLDKGLFSLFDGSTEKVRIDTEGNSWLNGGNVGIGTSSPTSVGGGAKLTVSQGADGNIVFARGGSTRQVQLGTTSTTGYINADNASGGLTFNVNTTERMRLDTSGNLGIGTSSPQSGGSNASWLSLNGTGSYSGGNVYTIGSATKAYTYFESDYLKNQAQSGFGQKFIVDGTNTAMTILSSGNVGIGTTSPFTKLDVVVSDVSVSPNASSSAVFRRDGDNYISLLSGTTGEGGMLFGNSGDAADGWVAYKNGSGNQYITIGTANSERMRIDSAGNVGIGTDSPSYKFTAYGSNTDSEIVASFGSSNDTNEYTAIGLSGFIASNGATKAGLALKRTTLYGAGELHFLNNTTTDNSDMTLSDSKMMINSSGNVGIGTTSPAATLHVGDGTGDDDIRVVYSDGSYTGIHGYGLYMSRNASYIRPTTDNTQSLYIGTHSKQWNTVEVDSSSTRFLTNGSEHMRINSSGNVGIGTSSPSAKLEIDGGTSTTLYINSSTHSSSTANEAILQFGYGHSGTPNGIGNIKLVEDSTNSFSGSMIFSVPSNNGSGGSSTAEAMRIDSSGNVGIGTTSPAQGNLVISPSSQAADVDGLVLVYNPDGASNKVRGQLRIDNYSGVLELKSSGNVITSKINSSGNSYLNGGNVGIGTTSPTSILHLLGGGGNDKQLRLATSSTAYWDIGRSNQTGHFEITEDSGDTYFLIRKDNGNVGIGTTSPDYPLHVYNATIDTVARFESGDASVALSLKASDNTALLTTSGTDFLVKNDGSGNLRFFNNSSERMRIDSSGRVGIGTTSPQAPLHANGGSSTGFATVKHLELGYTSGRGLTVSTSQVVAVDDLVTFDAPTATYGQMAFNTAGSEAMRINSSGNVGIGIENPIPKFHVYQDDTEVDTLTGATIEQDGTGDAALSFLLTGTKRWKLGIDNSDSDKFKISDSTNLASGNKLTIDSSGNVGIGTTSPTSKLSVEGNIASSGDLILDSKIVTKHSNTVKTMVVTVITKTAAHPAHGVAGASSLGYSIDGIESPELTFAVGNTYKFDQSHPSNANHPLRFYTDEAKTAIFGSGISYSNASPGQSGAYTQITPLETTPNTLYYQCSAHVKMGWKAVFNTRNLTNFLTDDLNEGSSNLYYTDARADARIAAASIDALSDVDTATSAPSSGQALVWDGNNFVPDTVGGTLTIQDEGSDLSTSGTTLNFVGTGVTASGTGATKTITIPGAASGITIQEEGSAVGTAATTLNFVGSTVTAAGSGANKTITITGSSGGSGGTSTIQRDTFSGNGSTTQFNLTSAIADEINTQVYVDGVYQSKLNYSTSGTTLTFSTAPPTGSNNIEVVHIASVSINNASTLSKNTFTGDGSTTAFGLSIAPTSEDFTFVFIQGVYQEKSTYSITSSTLNFSTAPTSGYSIEVMNIGAVNIQQTNYLANDTFTGNGTLTSFTLVNGSPTHENFTMVFLDGVYQAKAGYSLSGGAIVFSTAPANNVAIEIISVSGAGVKTLPPTEVNDVKYNVSVINSDTNASAGFVYVFTAALTLTLPALPNTGDSIKISNRSSVATCVLGANGNKIMGSSSNLTLDTASASFELIYSDATNGWVIIGQ